MKAGWAAAVAAAVLALPGSAETLRFATFNADLSRDGPGLLLQELRRGTSAQVAAVVEVIASAAPDVLLLTGVDWDHDLLALQALQAALAAKGAVYDYRFAPRPNSGMPSGLDLDGDGRLGGARDAQGYGRFAGEGGMALLSRLPVDTTAARDFSALLWRDLPDALTGGARLSPDALAQQRLSSTGHWDVPLRLPQGGAVHVLAFLATPPVFDGPEDRNGRRNHDEVRLLADYISSDGNEYLVDDAGARGGLAADAAFVILGDLNCDPVDGQGVPRTMDQLLKHPRVNSDFTPASAGAKLAAESKQNPREIGQGDPTHDTSNFGEHQNLRIDYALPSRGLKIVNSGVFWPLPDEPGADAITTTDHRLVWIDVAVE
jgi:hypothetical protein